MFEKSGVLEKIGEVIGYISAYFVFSTLLFFLLDFLGKLPASCSSYLFVMEIVLGIAVVGAVIRRLLR